MASFKQIRFVSGVMAGCCLLLLPLWFVGIVGLADSQYAKGWYTGFSVLFLYPLSWVLNYAAYSAVRYRLGDIASLRWQRGVSLVALTLLSIAAVLLILSFKLMLH